MHAVITTEKRGVFCGEVPPDTQAGPGPLTGRAHGMSLVLDRHREVCAPCRDSDHSRCDAPGVCGCCALPPDCDACARPIRGRATLERERICHTGCAEVADETLRAHADDGCLLCLAWLATGMCHDSDPAGFAHWGDYEPGRNGR